MKRLVLLTLVALRVATLCGQEKEGLFTGTVQSMSFAGFADTLESQTGVRIFFRPEWTDGILVSGSWENAKPLSIITTIISPRGLYCLDDKTGNIIITKGFAVRDSFKPVSRAGDLLSMSDTVTTVARDLMESEVITFGNPADRNREGRVLLSGFITNNATGEPVAGASVQIRELGAGVVTNQDGYYLLTVPRGSYKVEYRSLGSVDTYRNVNLYAGGKLSVSMDERVIAIRDAVVTASRRDKLDRLESGMARMNIMTIRLSPSSLGEADLIKSMLLLPGVQTVGEGSAGFNVRGGSADQNLILLYGAPVYNSSHFFGFFSAVNSEVINDVALYKGGIPSQYGGRVSSILEITEKDGNRKEYSGNAGISMIAAHLTIEGPVKKDHSSFLLAGRKTYSNWILGLLPDAALRNSKAGFYDINAHITADAGKNSQVELSAYYSHDDFRFNSDTNYAYDNHIISSRLRHNFSQSLFAVFSLTNSHYRYSISNTRIGEYAANMQHSVNTTSARANLTRYRSNGHELKFGGETNLHIINPGRRTPIPPLSVVRAKEIDRESGLESAIYTDYKADIGSRLTLRAGLRLSTFLAMGPETVYLYNPSFPKEANTITDSVVFRSGSITRAYAGPEARLSLNYRISGESSLKLNYNRTYQYLHLLSNTLAISPTDTWKLSDYHTRPQAGDQVAAGVYLEIMDNDYELSADGYYKWLHNLIDYKGGAVLTLNETIEQDLIPASGKAYGLELVLKKNRGKLKMTMNYTWSRVMIRSTGKFGPEIINRGEYYPANYDRPHDLNLQLNWLYSRRMNWSMNLVYATGRPVTYPVTWYLHSGVPVIHYSDRNQYRLPDYFRWDASLNIYGNLKAERLFRPSWSISMYNLTGRENVYSAFFRIENGKIQGYTLSVFGRMIPTLSYKIDF
ncbi:MAG: carboxypeptidase regulatory-like domain-containing protein [Actinomycetota bacterium]